MAHNQIIKLYPFVFENTWQSWSSRLNSKR